MFNFTKTNKSDSLNDKLQELENRFQEKMDEQTNAYNLHIQKLDGKIAGMEEKNKITYELMDKLYDYRFQEINNNTAKLSTQMSCKINQCISVYDNKLDNTFTTLQHGMQNINNQINILNNNQKEIFIEIQKLQNNAGNHFEEKIDTLTKQQEVTNEKLVALNDNVSELDDKIDVGVCELHERINKEIEKLDGKIDGLEEKIDQDAELWDITGTLQDNFKKINEKIKNLENISNQNIDTTCLITDKVEMCVSVINKINGKIKTLENVSNQNIDTSIITDKLEMCVNDIKKINEKIYEIELENISNPNIEDTIIQSINQEIVDISENKKKIPLSGKERAKKFYDKNPENERLRKNEYYKQQRILKGFPPPKKSHKYIGTECIDNQNAIMEHYYYEKSISYDGEAERLMSINL